MNQSQTAIDIFGDEITVEKDEVKKKTLLEKITQSALWKALEESGRQRAAHAKKHGYYY